MKPRFTDLSRYPRGYVRSEATNISKTWALARKKLEDDKKEREEKVREIKRIGSKA
jgi:hypothetical protein